MLQVQNVPLLSPLALLVNYYRSLSPWNHYPDLGGILMAQGDHVAGKNL